MAYDTYEIINRLNKIDDKEALKRRWKGHNKTLAFITPQPAQSYHPVQPKESLARKTLWAVIIGAFAVLIGGLLSGFAKRN